MRTVSLLFVVCCVFMLTAGEQNAQEIKNPSIVGQWEAANQTVEIFEDGKIIFSNKVKKEISEGSYKLIKDNMIRLNFEGSKPEDYSLSLSQDKLILTRANGEIFAVYKRAEQTSPTSKPK